MPKHRKTRKCTFCPGVHLDCEDTDPHTLPMNTSKQGTGVIQIIEVERCYMETGMNTIRVKCFVKKGMLYGDWSES